MYPRAPHLLQSSSPSKFMQLLSILIVIPPFRFAGIFRIPFPQTCVSTEEKCFASRRTIHPVISPPVCILGGIAGNNQFAAHCAVPFPRVIGLHPLPPFPDTTYCFRKSDGYGFLQNSHFFFFSVVVFPVIGLMRKCKDCSCLQKSHIVTTCAMIHLRIYPVIIHAAVIPIGKAFQLVTKLCCRV